MISFMEYGMNMAGLNIFRTHRKQLLEQLLFSDCLFSALASLQNTFYFNSLNCGNNNKFISIVLICKIYNIHNFSVDKIN